MYIQKELKEATSLSKEFWKPVVGYEGLYEVSNMGRIRSLDRIDSLGRKIVGKIKNQRNDLDGYKHVDLFKNGKAKTAKVHREVAMAFIPNPENLPQINHKDEDKANNRVDNLEWCTPGYNNNYGTHAERSRATMIRKNLRQGGVRVVKYSRNGDALEVYSSVAEAARQNNMNPQSIFMVLRGKTITSAGFVWRYYGDEFAIRKNRKKRGVVQYDTNNNKLNEYETIASASRKSNTTISGIWSCCNGVYKTAGGYIWKYKL